MSLWEAVLIAQRGLRAHRLRSALTMLGLIIGVSAVILLVAIGDGVQKSVNARIEPLADLITVVATIGDIPGGAAPKNLADADADADVAALAQAPDVVAVTPVVTGRDRPKPWEINCSSTWWRCSTTQARRARCDG